LHIQSSTLLYNLLYLIADLIVTGHEAVAQRGVHVVTKVVAGVLGIVVTARRSHAGQTERRARKRVNDNRHAYVVV
jgi:hypothetical protein